MIKPQDNPFDAILKDRFIHSSSHIIYDSISTLWHIDDESEKLISKIASKVVIGLFCLEYLSHLNRVIQEKAGIKGQITANDLTNAEIIDDVKNRLNTASKKDAAIDKHIKGIIASLTELLESADIKTLDELTKAAHLGDYLLKSLEDMEGVEKDDYNLWLYSIPHYYKKDLQETINNKHGMPQNKRQTKKKDRFIFQREK